MNIPGVEGKTRDCNCDPGDANGHHVWCDTYRPAGTTAARWEALIQTHPLLSGEAELDMARTYCLVVMTDNERFTARCCRPRGHDGEHGDTP